MKKIGSRLTFIKQQYFNVHIAITYIVCVLASFIAIGQTAFTVKAPSVVGVNEGFTVSYTLNAGNPSNFQPPKVTGARVVAGPYTSRSSSTTIVNGKVSSSSSVTFSFTLVAPQKGVITLSPAKITSEGKSYASGTVKIEAVNNPTSQQRQNNQQRQNSNPFSQYYSRQNQSSNQQRQPNNANNSASEDNISNDVMFVRAIPSKTNVVKGEEVIITYKLYTRIPVREYAIERIPSSSGFWIEELDNQANPTISEEIYNGRRYQVANLKKVIVYPQKSGTLTIKPMSLSLTAVITSRSRQQFSTGDPFLDQFFNDPFFFGGGVTQKQVQKKIYTNSITFNVKDLPTKPDSYCGGVGEFSLSSSVSTKQTKAFEAYYLTYTLTGNGNLTLINNLPLDLPDEFQISDPEITDNLSRTASGLSGTRTFRYLVIPRIEGTFKIPDLTLSYYNVAKGGYDSMTVAGYEIKVDKGDVSDDFALQLDQRAKYRNMDIKSNLRFSDTAKEYHIFDSAWIYLLPCVLMVLLAVCIFAYSRYRKLSADVVTMKMKKSTKLAVKRLKKAKKFLDKGNMETFEDETATALWKYLEERFKMDRTSLSIQGCKDELLSLGADGETVEKLGTILDRCQYLRFSQDKEATADITLYNDTVEVISSIEEQMKHLKKVKKQTDKKSRQSSKDKNGDSARLGRHINIPNGVSILLVLLCGSAFCNMPSAQNDTSSDAMNGQTNVSASQTNASDNANVKTVKSTAVSHTTQPLSAERLCRTAESYFRQSDYANAMLYYEKALKLSPADKDIQLNINIVRSRLVGDTYIIPEFVLVRWVKQISGLFSLPVWLLLFVGLFLLACVFFFFYVFTSDKKVLFFYLSLFSLIFSLVSMGFGIVRQNIQNDNSRAILMKSNVHLRQSKNTTAKDVMIMYKGQKIKILDEDDNNWIKVQTEDNKQGYMENKNYKRI